MIKRYKITGGAVVEDRAGDWCCDWDVCELEQENAELRSLCKKLFESHDGVGLSVLHRELAEMGFMGQVNGKQLKGCE